MPQQSFLHVADVHLDSPLARVRKLGGRIADQLQRASRASFESVVDLALEHEVGAVLISGDLFDGPIRDASSALWVEGQFRRLTRAGTKVLLILGNHDAISVSQKVTQWSEGVIEFSSDSAETHLFDELGLAVHGQSFGARAQTQDLAAKYPNAVPGYFNVGLLHTSLSSPGAHNPYAPTTVSLLENSGYDYWALGHIHVRSQHSLSSKCYVGYSGNTQGRSIRETGAKGCNLVRYSDGKLDSVEFQATDSVRWSLLDLDVSRLEHLTELEDALEERLAELVHYADNHPLVVRVSLQGETALQGELSRTGTQENIAELFSQVLQNAGDFWLESVRVQSSPIPALRNDDILGPLEYLSRVADLAKHDSLQQKDLEECLEELLRKARRELNEYGWRVGTGGRTAPESGEHAETELTEWIRKAENLLVSRLMGDNVA